MKKLFEGYNAEGIKVEVVLDDGRITVRETATGEEYLYNDELYEEDDFIALASVKASLISEGFRS